MHFGFIGPKRQQGVLGIVAIQQFHLVNCFEGIHSKWNNLYQDVWVLFLESTFLSLLPLERMSSGSPSDWNSLFFCPSSPYLPTKEHLSEPFMIFFAKGNDLKLLNMLKPNYLPNNRWLISDAQSHSTAKRIPVEVTNIFMLSSLLI